MIEVERPWDCPDAVKVSQLGNIHYHKIIQRGLFAHDASIYASYNDLLQAPTHEITRAFGLTKITQSERRARQQ
jgi:hypothetical protein